MQVERRYVKAMDYKVMLRVYRGKGNAMQVRIV